MPRPTRSRSGARSIRETLQANPVCPDHTLRARVLIADCPALIAYNLQDRGRPAICILPQDEHEYVSSPACARLVAGAYISDSLVQGRSHVPLWSAHDALKKVDGEHAEQSAFLLGQMSPRAKRRPPPGPLAHAVGETQCPAAARPDSRLVRFRGCRPGRRKA